MKDIFSVRNTKSNTEYKLTRQPCGRFIMTWEEDGKSVPAPWLYSEKAVIDSIREGVWEVIEAPDSFATRLAFFQTHIDAVEENLASLKKAFEELKSSV